MFKKKKIMTYISVNNKFFKTASLWVLWNQDQSRCISSKQKELLTYKYMYYYLTPVLIRQLDQTHTFSSVTTWMTSNGVKFPFLSWSSEWDTSCGKSDSFGVHSSKYFRNNYWWKVYKTWPILKMVNEVLIYKNNYTMSMHCGSVYKELSAATVG